MNDVMITGTMSAPQFDHEVNGDRIYKATITTKRTSGTEDVLPILIPSYLCHDCPTRVRLYGEFRSHNTAPDENGRKHLQLYIYVINMFDAYGEEDANEINMEGFVCKSPVRRTTPGGRKITDLLVAVPRTNIFDRSDYIPTIVWGDKVPELKISDQIQIKGRIQSRKYGEKTAYEVSVAELTKQN